MAVNHLPPDDLAAVSVINNPTSAIYSLIIPLWNPRAYVTGNTTPLEPPILYSKGKSSLALARGWAHLSMRSNTSWDNAHGTATSASWKIRPRAWRTNRPPILISLTCTLRRDQSFTASGKANLLRARQQFRDMSLQNPVSMKCFSLRKEPF